LWEFFKVYWRNHQNGQLSPWQGALCGSLAGGIAASLTTPLGYIFLLRNNYQLNLEYFYLFV